MFGFLTRLVRTALAAAGLAFSVLCVLPSGERMNVSLECLLLHADPFVETTLGLFVFGLAYELMLER
ncbi:hypothetical protein [Salinirubrum litoreum]|uniref:Uncharacterized protein n=1 Tax=Salinirubrum litoreum TaxID=1126234 RepID=A0ABD5R666_9EURY|nr:hypothetical protein [Salinirubrum litoreum]